jgi:hypothetical protein
MRIAGSALPTQPASWLSRRNLSRARLSRQLVSLESFVANGLHTAALSMIAMYVSIMQLLTTGNVGIKQEHEITGLEGLDFSLPPELASKRPLGDEGEVEETASKRLKGENIPDNDLEDGLALLVQNALSGVGDLVGDFDGSGTGVGDAMDTDPSSLLDNAVPSSTFYSEPLKYVRGVQTYALANLVLYFAYPSSYVIANRAHQGPHTIVFSRAASAGRRCT